MNSKYFFEGYILLTCAFFSCCTTSAQPENSKPNTSSLPVARVPAEQPTPESLNDETFGGKLQTVVQKVRHKTNLPVLVPGRFPGLENQKALFIDDESDHEMYKITVGTKRHCGSNDCLVAVFMAERDAEPPSADEVDKQVTLERGIQGFYTSKSCGASCSPPQIEFMYKNVLYTLQVRSTNQGGDQDEKNLINMANSAILSEGN